MSYPSKSLLHISRIARFPGRLKSAHLAAIIGVKSLVAFRDDATDDAGGKDACHPPTAPLPPSYTGRLLRVYPA